MSMISDATGQVLVPVGRDKAGTIAAALRKAARQFQKSVSAAAISPPVHDSAVATVPPCATSAAPSCRATSMIRVDSASGVIGKSARRGPTKTPHRASARTTANTSKVKNAASRSSNMMPNPPLSRASKCPMGGGFTISKKRNTANASA